MRRETARAAPWQFRTRPFYWADRAYVLSRNVPVKRDKLCVVAQAAYDQIDLRTPQQGG